MMIDLTPLLEAALALAVALITYRLIPWIKARTTAQQQVAMQMAVSTLVYAAEQLYGPGGGKTKLEYVLGGLQERGYKIDMDAIEAEVRRLTIEQEKDKPPDDPGNPD